MKKADLYFNVARLPVDFLMLILAGTTTYLLRTRILSIFRPVLFSFNLPLSEYIYLVLFVAMLFIAAYALSGLYSMHQKIGRMEEFSKIVVASSGGIMAVIVFIFLRQELFNSRFLLLGGYLLAILFVYIGRLIIRMAQRISVANYNFGIHRLVIIGHDKVANQIGETIRNNPAFGYRIVAELQNPDIIDLADVKDIDEIILTDSNYSSEKILELIDYCHEHHIVFKFVPNLYQTLTSNFSLDVLGDYPIIELKRTPMDGWGKVAKRLIDILCGVFGIIITSPIFLIVAFCIKWETAGPVFVNLKRISKNRQFDLYKFRSMIRNAEELKPLLSDLNERGDGPLFKMKHDPRVTKVGGIIRKYRIDEIPQFWNILKGDISLVGPRPHQPDEISKYEKHHKKVLAIKAGATGLAQVSGSSDLPFEKEVALDVFYIENWSIIMDFKIIIRTVFKIFTDRTAV
jgi:exopolysaccharide biosynthesis polyprenyl glycosylphosphotransferase